MLRQVGNLFSHCWNGIFPHNNEQSLANIEQLELRQIPPSPVLDSTSARQDLRGPAVNNPALLQIQPLTPAASNSSEINAEALSLPSVPAVAVINFQEAINAVKAGRAEEVRQYLAQPGIDIDQKNAKGWTLLHFAALLSDPAIAALLVKAGAQLGIQDKRGFAPAHVAAGCNSVAVLQCLAEKGTDFDRENSDRSMFDYSALELPERSSADLNEKDADNITPLHYAARNDAEESAKVLIAWLGNNNIGVDSPQKGNWTPLHFAAHYGCPKVAQLLVDAGADVSLKNGRGQTPIEIARQKQQECRQQLEVAQKKAEQLSGSSQQLSGFGWEQLSGSSQQLSGSSQEQQKKNKQRIKELATKQIKLDEVVDILSSALERVNVPSFKQAIYAVKTGQLNAVNRYLTQEDVDVIDRQVQCGEGSKDNEGWTLLHYAARLPDPAMAALLVNAGAQLGIQDKRGFAPAHVAAGCNSAPVLEILTASGANLNEKDADNITPLHYAARNDAKESATLLINWLITRGIGVDSLSKGNWTPLHFAAQYGCPSVAQLLVDAGADVSLENARGQTPIEIAQQKEAQEGAQCWLTGQEAEYESRIEEIDNGLDRLDRLGRMVDILSSALGRVNVPSFKQAIYAVKTEQQNAVNRYLKQEDVIDRQVQCGEGSKDNEGWTLLHYAARLPKSSMADLLIMQGFATINIQDKRGLAPAHVAAGYNSAAVLESLAASSANLNEKDADNVTPLHYAARNDAEESAKVLIAWLGSNNIGVDSPNKDNWTPLHFAAQYGRPSVAQLLVDAGADVSLKNARGQTPIEIARQKQQKCWQQLEEARNAQQSLTSEQQEKNAQRIKKLAAKQNNLNDVVLIISATRVGTQATGIAPRIRVCAV